MKYKVGDRVRMTATSKINNRGRIGLFGTVIGSYMCCGTNHFCVEFDEHIEGHDGNNSHGVKKGKFGHCWWYHTEDGSQFDIVCNTQKIVITSDGTETLAHLYDGEKVVKKATAKCSPDDTFDFKTGAKLAFDRLIGEVKEEWRVVNRKPKVGDYVRIKHNDYKELADVGDILKVDEVYNHIVSFMNKNMPRPSKNKAVCDTHLWNYFFFEVEVVEPVNPQPVKEEKPQKEEPKFKVGDRVRCTSYPVLWFKVGDIGTIVKDDGTMVPYEIKTDDGHKVWTKPCNLEKVEEPFKFEVGKLYQRTNLHGILVIEITERYESVGEKRYKYKVVFGIDNGSHDFAEFSKFGNELKPYDPPKYYNGKAVCIETKPCWAYTVGKVYEFKDGTTVINNGNRVYTSQPVVSIDEWNEKHGKYAKMLEIVE